MFRTMLFSAAGAGLAVGLIVSGVQSVTTTPLILKAEVYEDRGSHEHVGDGHEAMSAEAQVVAAGSAEPAAAEEEAWAPGDGFERIAYTAGANIIVGVAISLVLVGLMSLRSEKIDARRGLLWGAAGFVAVSLLPAAGLPPELPGTPAADLLARQTWWIGTILASGAGLALIAFSGHWAWRAGGVVLLVLPHVIGAPHPPSLETAYPAVLLGEFVIASLIVSALTWVLAGAAVGGLYDRLSSHDGLADGQSQALA